MIVQNCSTESPSEIRRQRPRGQLVQQPTGRHHEHAGQQGDVDGARAVDGNGARHGWLQASAASSCCARPSKVSQAKHRLPTTGARPELTHLAFFDFVGVVLQMRAL